MVKLILAYIGFGLEAKRESIPGDVLNSFAFPRSVLSSQTQLALSCYIDFSNALNIQKNRTLSDK